MAILADAFPATEGCFTGFEPCSTADQSSRCMFGVIAVGRLVRVYKYEDGKLGYLHGDGSPYFIDRQCMTVTENLEYIRDNC